MLGVDLEVMEEEEKQSGAEGGGGGGGKSLKDEEVLKDVTDTTAPDEEEEDEDTLPHSEILDIFEEGLARLVQDPLLCDLPIQVRRPKHTCTVIIQKRHLHLWFNET